MKLAYKYQLPSPHVVIQYKLKKLRWKRIVNQKVWEYWQAKLTQSLLPSLANSPSWKQVDLNTHAVSKARLQACVLTNTYTLQSHRATYIVLQGGPHIQAV